MPQPVIDAALKGDHGEKITIVAGNANAATKEVYGRRIGFNKILIEGDAAFRMAFVPAIESLWHFDSSATPQWVSLLDENKAVINRNEAAGTGTQLDSMATADFIYVGTNDKHGGLFIDMLSFNGTTSTLTMSYSKSDGTFASQAITDNTASGGATFGQDGNIILNAVPTDWTDQNLSTLLSDSTAPTDKLYWVRFDVSVELDSDTEIGEFTCFHQTVTEESNTGPSGFFKASTEYTFNLDADVGGFEIREEGTAGSKFVKLTQFDLR